MFQNFPITFLSLVLLWSPKTPLSFLSICSSLMEYRANSSIILFYYSVSGTGDTPSPRVQAAAPSVIPPPLLQMRLSSESQETRPLVLLSFPPSTLFWATPCPVLPSWSRPSTSHCLPPHHSTLLLLCL